MPSTPAVIQFGPVGWLMLLALIITVVTRLLKADNLNTWLLKMGLPALPKVAVPWITLVLGFGGGMIQALVGGHSLSDSALMGAWSLFGSTVAIAGHEALEKPTRAVLGEKAGDVMFGKRSPLLDTKAYGQPFEVEKRPPPPPDAPKPPPPVALVASSLSALVLGVALIVGLPGCAAFAAAVPVIEEIIPVIVDASTILNSIRVVEQNYFVQHPNPDIQKKVEQAELDAHLALVAAMKAAQGAKDVNDKEVIAAVEDFQAAYKSLTALLTQLGVVSAEGKLAAAPGHPSIQLPTPALMKFHKK